MIVTLIRYSDDGKRTLGRLFINGIYHCYTLEDPFHDMKVKGDTRIPAGVYDLELRHSPKFTPLYGHKMIWVKEVPNFDFILIHKGNTGHDTAGCLLVGLGVFKNSALLNSSLAYNQIYPLISKQIESGKGAKLVVLDYDRIS